MSRKRLPYEPESLESLQKRYPDAIAKVIDVESVSLGLQYDPGSDRKHVFDTEDGIRLIISREDQGEDGLVIHFSGSAMTEVFPDDYVNNGLEFILDLFVRRFQEISGDRRKIEMILISAEGIPHWFIIEPPGKRKDAEPAKLQL